MYNKQNTNKSILTNNIKEDVLNYLYNKIEMNDHKYTIIKTISDVFNIKNNTYYLSGNSCGINSFIIFFKRNDKFYSYWIDRRSISYNKQTLKKETVRMSEIKINVDLSLYDGTILDGILIDNDNSIISNKSNNINNKMKFMITDTLLLAGKSQLNIDYKAKMTTLVLLKNKIFEDNIKNNIEFYISRVFEINQVNSLFKKYIKPNIKDYNIKGLTFYPKFSGNKLIYIFDKTDEKYKNELLNDDVKINLINNKDLEMDEYEFSDKKKIYKFELNNPEYIDDIIINLEMKKTDTCDVYKLYGIFYAKNNKKDVYIKKYIGIAYIPTYSLSLQCNIYFMNKEKLIMKCKFNTNKNKWIPIEESSIQKIDIINNDIRFKVIEEDYEENELDNFNYNN
jgi:hypothetical protein